MNTQSKILCLALFLTASLFAGCDPVRTTRQIVHFEIVRSDDGTPATGLEIRIKSEHLSSFSASTNNDGLADISVERTMIDRSRSTTPSHNLINGITPFKIELIAANVEAEHCSMILKEGSSTICGDYKIVVKSIDDSIYVPTQ